MKFFAAFVTLLTVAMAAPAPEVATEALDARSTSPCPAGKAGLCCGQWTSSQEAVGVCASPSTASNQDTFRTSCHAQSTPGYEWRAYCCEQNSLYVTPRGYTGSGCWRV